MTEKFAKPDAVVAELRRLGSRAGREGMARFALPSEKAFGVPMAAMQNLAKRIGRSHGLAEALWRTGWYEARTVAAFVDEPERVTPAQMDRWARDFDSWGICDTVCFTLFDRTPHAFAKVKGWAGRREEFVKRAAFALLASLSLHDKTTGDEPFLRSLPLVERAASDDRNFVKKGVIWALRALGQRSRALHAAALKLARRLAASPQPSAGFIGREAVRELSSPAVLRRLKARRAPGRSAKRLSR